MTECLPNLPRFIIEREDGSWQGADHPNGPWRSIPVPQQALPWPTDGPAVPESREPASVAPAATGQPRPLNPAAQAVLDAYGDFEPANVDAMAAALRAVADQVVPEEPLYGGDQRWIFERDARQTCRKKLLAIAAELEGVQ